MNFEGQSRYSLLKLTSQSKSTNGAKKFDFMEAENYCTLRIIMFIFP